MADLSALRNSRHNCTLDCILELVSNLDRKGTAARVVQGLGSKRAQVLCTVLNIKSNSFRMLLRVYNSANLNLDTYA
jgi:hypothetical protein